ncbi:MAG: sigma-70 family RNA polymerase sigma factor [Planctomycetes bacterium]|nr:sigma-70 family RNA polymerase sigma factor [Planctomycetota bacterium]
METTRASLLQRVRDPQDQTSWREFYQLYQPLLYRYARGRGLDRENAEELTQQCMTLLTTKMPEFVYSKEKGGFKHWLRRVANNKVNDMFKKKRMPTAQSGDFRRPQQRELSPDELWEQQWKKRHLQFCLKQIQSDVAPNTYQAFQYHVLSGWSVERVAETLGITTDQVYTAKSRITRRLRTKMRELLGEGE